MRENVKQDAQTAVGPQAEHDSTCSESRDKVFDTSEIIEGILECLPAKTLFVVRRANKRFHETIADPPRIQRKMFLCIDNDHSVVWEAQDQGLSSMSSNVRPVSRCSSDPQHLISRLWALWFLQIRSKLPRTRLNPRNERSKAGKLLSA